VSDNARPKAVGPGAFLVSKALAGLVILVPLAILFLAVTEVYALLEQIAAFAALQLPFPPVVNAVIFIALNILAVFILCLFVGILLTSRLGKKFAHFVEHGIADKIPLLGLVRNLTMSVTGSGKSELKPVEVDLQGTGTCMLGFLMETLPDGRYVVFVPSAPAMTLGQVYIVPPERVKLLGAPLTAIVNAVTQWGTGAGDIYKDK